MNVSEVRNLLGLAGYYQRFVRGFSSIAMSMMKLLQNDKKFVWNDKWEMSFTKLKTRLTTALILNLSSDAESFVIYNHASSKGLRCVLM